MPSRGFPPGILRCPARPPLTWPHNSSQVAQEQGWSRQECIDALIHKAGCTAQPVSEAMRASLEVVRYQSHTCTMTYQEYLKMKSRNCESPA